MEAVIVATIAAVGGILAALVQMSRKENKADHGVVALLLKDLHEDVKDVDTKLEKHIDWHADKVITKKVVKPATVKK
jgi:hypothetical protein